MTRVLVVDDAPPSGRLWPSCSRTKATLSTPLGTTFKHFDELVRLRARR
jgi:hypothetical protein